MITPIDFWTAALATSTAALAASAAVTQAALLPWQAARVDRHQGDADASLRPALRPAPAEKVRHVKSWYRAPYSSPFDPAFWMSPGHPGDHLPMWMGANWMNFWAQSANPVAGYSAPAGTGTLGGGWMGPWTSFGAGSNDAGAWPATWPLALMGSYMMMPVGAGGFTSASNVVEFPSAYSAYRSAGGHAAAQVTRAEPARLADAGAVSPLMLPAEMWTAWMKPWLPR